MKARLQKEHCLTDTKIDHYSALLQEKFSSVNGLQRCCVFSPGQNFYVGTPTGKFVQILHFSDNHWITVSNMHCALPGQVKFYDSVYRDFQHLSQASHHGAASLVVAY